MSIDVQAWCRKSVENLPSPKTNGTSSNGMAQAFSYTHVPVMTQEVLCYLQPRMGGKYCDATLGGGGHTEAILQAIGSQGHVLGIDRDNSALEAAHVRLARFTDQCTFYWGTFDQLPQGMKKAGLSALDGLLADVGVSSPQLDQAERGFSFRHEGPLDMRMDPTQGEPAWSWIARASEQELAEILRVYGEERFAKRVARAIKKAWEQGLLLNTKALAEVVTHALPPEEKGKNPATRTFQALRIAVNDELRQLDSLLQAADAYVKPGGRLVILSFHSLEDRLVKQHFRQKEQQGLWRILTPRPLLPRPEECRSNPRSRSARLRAAERLEKQAV